MATISYLRLGAIVLSLVAFISFANCTSKLNARRVLLPYNLGVPTNFTLGVIDGGCYRWSTSRPDVASITPIELDDSSVECSAQAVVSAVSRSSTRQSTVVLATEVGTGKVLRADVEVDAIKSIEIITTTREIALDDVPEAFEVHAKNDQNNTFTGLGGIEFEWLLQQVNSEGDGTSTLRFRKFSELSYNLESTECYWDDRDLQGSRVLIEGVKTGTSKVVVRIKDKSYKNVLPSEITLVVIANIFLVPSSSVYLLPNAQIDYKVNIVKGQQMKELPLPSDQYYLEISNPKIVQLEPLTSTATGLKEGLTSIVLKDRNINSETAALRQPTSDIIVTKPSYMRLQVDPGTDNWILQEWTTYTITVALFDVYHHRIYPSPNLNLQLTFPIENFEVLSKTANGTHFVVQTIRTGEVPIKGTLIGAFKQDGSVSKLPKPLEVEQLVQIFPQLRVTPPSVFLPWDDLIKPTYTIFPYAEGGTGNYRWESLNSNLASVKYKSEIKKSAKASVVISGEGNTTIVVTDQNNHVFRREMSVSVSEVVDMGVIPGIVEATVGSPVYVQVAFYGTSNRQDSKSKLQLFDDCVKVPIVVDVVEKNRVKYVDDANEGLVVSNACRAVRFDCLSPGHSRVWISYVSPLGEVINSTSVVSCFLPLKQIHPLNEGLIALGTSIEVVFEGGPRKWPLNTDGYFSRLSSDTENIFDINSILDPYRYKKDLHVFRVSCKHLGETKLTVEIGNAPSATLPNPALETLTLQMICANPVLLTLRPKIKKSESCPMSVMLSSKIPISGLDVAQIELNAKNEAGLTFHNISSLEIDWSISDSSLAQLKSSKNFVEEVNGAGGFRRWNRNYNSLEPMKKEGELSISVSSTSFRKDVLSSEGVIVRPEMTPLKTEVTVSLVDRPQIVPGDATLFNHASSQLTLQILKGSGHFQVSPLAAESGIANVTFSGGSKQINLRPITDGLLHLKISDACVEFEPPTSPNPDAQVLIRVSDPKAIKLWSPDKIELGKEIEIAIEVIDSSGQAIPSRYHKLLEIEADFGSDIFTVRHIEKTDNLTHSFAMIKGERIGSAGVIFKSMSANKLYSKRVISPELVIEVFPPLRVEPESLTLIPGAHFELIVSGGPQSDAVVEFSIANEETARIAKNGFLEALSTGKTHLIAKSKSVSSNTIYSQDQIVVDIVQLHAVKLETPTKHVVVGSILPLTILGIGPLNEIVSPFYFGSAIPSLEISWTTSNGQVLEISNALSKLSIQDDKNMFGVRCKALKEGTAVVRISMKSTENLPFSRQQIRNNALISDNITIQIISELNHGSGLGGGRILMSPESEFPLRSTRDGVAKVTYAIKSGLNKIAIEKAGPSLKSLTAEASESVLEMKSQESNGITQISTSLIQIRPVKYLAIVPEPSIHLQKGENLAMLPLGSNLQFTVNFFNSLGQRFDSVSSKVRIRLNRSGIVGFSWISSVGGNVTVLVSALKEGSALMRVWIEGGREGNAIEDVIKIQVGQITSPRVKRLLVGDVLCLSSPLLTPEGRPGTWSSSDPDALSFMPSQPSIAFVQKQGKIRTKQDLSGFSTLSEEIIVSPANQLKIDSRGISFISNIEGSEINLPLTILDDSSNEAKLSTHGCTNDLLKTLVPPFKCNIKFSSSSVYQAMQIVTCRPSFDLISKKFQLVVSTNSSSSNLNQEVISTTKSSLEITVASALTSLTSPAVTIPFIPAFHLHQKELVLTNLKPLRYLTINGLDMVVRDSLQVVPVNDETRKTVDIFPPELIIISEQVVGAQIPIQLKGKLDSLWQTTSDPSHHLQLRVYSPVTKQSEVVEVSIQWVLDGASQCIKLARPSLYDSRSTLEIIVDLLSMPIDFVLENYQQLISVICLLLVLLVTIQFFKKSKQFPQQENSFYHTSFSSYDRQNISREVSSPQQTTSGTTTPAFGRFGAMTPLKVKSTPSRVTSSSPGRNLSPPPDSPGRPNWTRPR